MQTEIGLGPDRILCLLLFLSCVVYGWFDLSVVFSCTEVNGNVIEFILYGTLWSSVCGELFWYT